MLTELESAAGEGESFSSDGGEPLPQENGVAVEYEHRNGDLRSPVTALPSFHLAIWSPPPLLFFLLLSYASFGLGPYLKALGPGVFSGWSIHGLFVAWSTRKKTLVIRPMEF